MFTTPYKEAIADVLNELSAALEADEDQIVTPENYIVSVICKILWGGQDLFERIVARTQLPDNR